MHSYLQIAENDLASTVEELALDALNEPSAKVLAESLRDAENGLILLGHQAMRHPDFALIRRAAVKLAETSGTRIGYLSEGANAAGASLAGALPHRLEGGAAADSAGRNLAAQLKNLPGGVILFGLEPEHDLANGDLAVQRLADAEFVVSFTPFAGPGLLEVADILLPIGTFAETDGSYVNVEGRWQSFEAVIEPLGEARPGWKVLRVLANRLGLSDCEYASAAEITQALRALVGDPQPDNSLDANAVISGDGGRTVPGEELDVPIYRVDSLVRRAPALQAASDPGEAGRHKLLARMA